MGNFHRNKYHISHELERTQKLCFLDLVFFFGKLFYYVPVRNFAVCFIKKEDKSK